MIKTRVGMEGFDLLVVVIADCVTQKTACSVAIIANACKEVNQGKNSTALLKSGFVLKRTIYGSAGQKIANFCPPRIKYFPGPNIS